MKSISNPWRNANQGISRAALHNTGLISIWKPLTLWLICVTSGKRVNFSFQWLSRFVGDAETASLASSYSLNFLGIWEFQEDSGTGIIPTSAPQGWHSLHLASLWQDQWRLPSLRFCWHVAKSPGPAICSDHSLVLFLGWVPVAFCVASADFGNCYINYLWTTQAVDVDKFGLLAMQLLIPADSSVDLYHLDYTISGILLWVAVWRSVDFITTKDSALSFRCRDQAICEPSAHRQRSFRHKTQHNIHRGEYTLAVCVIVILFGHNRFWHWF